MFTIGWRKKEEESIRLSDITNHPTSSPMFCTNNSFGLLRVWIVLVPCSPHFTHYSHGMSVTHSLVGRVNDEDEDDEDDVMWCTEEIGRGQYFLNQTKKWRLHRKISAAHHRLGLGEAKQNAQFLSLSLSFSSSDKSDALSLFSSLKFYTLTK